MTPGSAQSDSVTQQPQCIESYRESLNFWEHLKKVGVGVGDKKPQHKINGNIVSEDLLRRSIWL